MVEPIEFKNLVDVIMKLIKLEDNYMLMEHSTKEELRKVFFELYLENSLDLDGF